HEMDAGAVGGEQRRRPFHVDGAVGGAGVAACRAERDRYRRSCHGHRRWGAGGAERYVLGHVLLAGVYDAERELGEVRGVPDDEAVGLRTVDEAEDDVGRGAAPTGEDGAWVDRLGIGIDDLVSEFG